MKLTPEEFAHIEKEINEKTNRSKELWKYYKDRGLSRDWYRWDMLYRAKLIPYLTVVLYPRGIKDSHIDTALRKITKEDYDDATK